MKAMYFTKGGSIEHLESGELNVPQIKEDELLIKVHASGMNPSDYQTLEFMDKTDRPVILGLDIVGEVAACGRTVEGLKKGDRVVYLREVMNPFGGYAEYAVTPASLVCRIPDGIDDTEAAVLPGAGMTAYHIMYDRFHLKEGKTMLIQGGAGGVGSYAIQMAKHEGVRVLTSCLGRDIEYVKSLGADAAFDFQKEDVHQKVLDETDQKGVDYIVSMAGPAVATKDLGVARFNCEVAVTAGLPELSGWKFYEKGLTIHEIALGNFLTSPDEEMRKEPLRILDSLADMVKEKTIHIPKVTVIALEEIPAYLKKMKAGEITGKVVVKVY